MQRLGEPAPQLYRVIDNPTLSRLAMDLFAEEVAPGHRAWLQRQREQMWGHMYQLPEERFLQDGRE